MSPQQALLIEETRDTSTSLSAQATAPWSDRLCDLYLRHFNSLVGLARRVVRDQALAEECVQDAFLKFHAKGVCPKAGSELAYVRSMVRNGAISKLRVEARQRERLVRVGGASRTVSAETSALARLSAVQLAAHVRDLAPRQAQVVGLRLAGLSVAETAQSLSVSAGTVKTHRHRAAAAMEAFSPEHDSAALGRIVEVR